MSKKLKNSKNTTTLVNLVIEELENKNFDLEVLQKIQGEFSTAGKKEQREDFITAIGKLSNKQLHKLNRAVVENANELMPSNDPNFVCRTANNKIFHELFLLEARNCGMKAKFNIKKELQPLNVKDIPQEILNHYFILEQKFYPQRSSKDSIDSRIAQSINFLLYAPLFRESELYTQIGQKKLLEIEVELQKPNGKYVQNLVKEKIAEHLIRHINIKENFENKQNEEKEEKISLIIEKSIEKLEKSKKVFVKDQQREKIKRHISKFLEEVSDEILTFNKKDLIDVFHQELYKKQSKWSKLVNYLGIKSYSISSENIERIKGVMNSKIKNFHYPIINQEIQKQLKQISKELNNFNNSKLPSEIKKAKPEIQKNEKPPIPPKPQNLKKGKRVLDHK